jgi:hypothetical protein
VCYSLLERGNALAIHGRFRLSEGMIQQEPDQEPPDAVSGMHEARNAQEWYRRIVRDSFGV